MVRNKYITEGTWIVSLIHNKTFCEEKVMRKRKLFAVCVATVAAMGMLTGCSKNSTENEFERYAQCATVTDYENVEYVPESREVTQDEIDSKISDFCDENSETTEDKTSVIASGDTININYVETINGEEVDSSTDEEGYEITVGEEDLAPDLDDQLIGHKAGDKATFTVVFPDDYDDETVAGMEAEFEITFNFISVTTVPEYTDELVNTATDGEYTTTTDYTAHITEDLQSDKDEEADEADRASVLNAVKEKATFIEYPESDIEDYIDTIVSNIESNASNYGIEFETFLMYFYGYNNESEFLDFLQETVESAMQEKIVVCSIAVDKNLIAGDDDITAYKNKLMEENDVDEEEISNYYSDSDLAFYATEEKVLDYLMESAVQVEDTEEDTEEDEASVEESDDSDDAVSDDSEEE
jgi:trigger factor